MHNPQQSLGVIQRRKTMPAKSCPLCSFLIVNPDQPCPSCHYALPVSATPSPQIPQKPPVYIMPLVVSFCHIIGGLYFLLSLLGVFVVWRDYDFVIVFVLFLLSLVTALFIYGLGDIINQLFISNYNAEIMKQQNEKIIQALEQRKM